jgi:AraC-like DNA-binding protein
MHRHDTYAIGLTLEGVQSFYYRGEVRNSSVGEAVALYPDEKHDGQARTDSGFRYRMLYFEAAVVLNALQGAPLPFIRSGVTRNIFVLRAAGRLLPDLRHSLDPFEQEDALCELARALQAASDAPPRTRRGSIDIRAVEKVRAYLASIPKGVSLARLEHIAGQNRWALTRDFRATFGVSPYRYLTMRRLNAAKRAMGKGRALAQAASDTGFSDQSHMTRQFKAAYGLTPGRWLRLQHLRG